MASLNKVMLIGNLTRDVETRFTPSGTCIAGFGIACNRKWKDAKTGELKEEVTFVDIELFGKTAEVAQKYLAKGKSVFIEGRLKLDTWEDKGTGQKRSKLKVIGETLQFLSDGKQQTQAKPTAQPAPQADHDLGISDEGIPY
jgi:single-strand DNA-binding protein